MKRGIINLFMILAIVTTGCVSTRENSTSTANRESNSSFLEKISAATEPARDSLQKLTNAKQQVRPPQWNWATAVPVEVKRSQVVSAIIPRNTLASLTPEINRNDVALVSSPSPQSSFQVVNIAGQTIRNCADFFDATENAVDNKDELVQVDLVDLSAPEDSPETAVELDAKELVQLSQMIAPNQPAMRLTKDGNPWIVFRENGIRCKLMARAERVRGLLHVVVSIANCADEPILLPAEVRASCDNRDLRCCSVSETLETLYGNPKWDSTSTDKNECSFISVSEREDYRIPMNYRRIDKEIEEAYRESIQKPVPAFASLHGMTYPGTAALGDARALSGFLMQQQSCSSGDPEHVGWLVFSGDSLSDGGTIDISIDLGTGIQTFQFFVPSE